MLDWRLLTVTLPRGADTAFTVTVDRGTGGQPQHRAQITFARATGAELSWKPFAAGTPGRRLRSVLRFAHTGEVLGLAGQTVAMLVSLGGAVLVWTGLALSTRRFAAWRARRARRAGDAEEAPARAPGARPERGAARGAQRGGVAAGAASVRPCRASTARSRSCGSACTRKSSAPVIVRAASSALTIAPSVACTVAANSGLRRALGSISVRTIAVSAAGARVGRAERDEDVARRVLPEPAHAPTPSATRVATRRSWCGRSGASVATTTMIEPAPASASPEPPSRAGAAPASAQRGTRGPERRVARGDARQQVGDRLAHRHAGDAQQAALAVVALHEHAHRPAALLGRQAARRGADAALEAVADHPRAAAHVPSATGPPPPSRARRARARR
jgi:hypothetical protein